MGELCGVTTEDLLIVIDSQELHVEYVMDDKIVVIAKVIDQNDVDIIGSLTDKWYAIMLSKIVDHETKQQLLI